MESNALRYFRVTFEIWARLDCLFLKQKVIFIANVKALSHQKVLNKPQAEGRVIHVCTAEHRKRINTSAIKNKTTKHNF